MISRRIIRVKVMQALYALESLETDIKPGEPLKLLQKYFDQTQALLVFLLHTLTEISGYAETDSRQRAGKHLPTAEDLNVNIKLAGNEILWKIKEDASYQQALKDTRAELMLDKELVRKIYTQLTESSEYRQYINTQGRNTKEEKQILDYIFNDLMLANSLYISLIEDLFTNWDDDGEMMQLLVQNYLQKPATYNFQEMLSREKWNFAKDLLHTVREKESQTMEMIKPKLKNWDPERIAVLDMILMQMGVCEFLYFETIPPKVTINEYIDLAKEYSTLQSGQFVNGILDNIHKDLVREDKLHKIDFKKNN